MCIQSVPAMATESLLLQALPPLDQAFLEKLQEEPCPYDFGFFQWQKDGCKSGRTTSILQKVLEVFAKLTQTEVAIEPEDETDACDADVPLVLVDILRVLYRKSSCVVIRAAWPSILTTLRCDNYGFVYRWRAFTEVITEAHPEFFTLDDVPFVGMTNAAFEVNDPRVLECLDMVVHLDPPTILQTGLLFKDLITGTLTTIPIGYPIVYQTITHHVSPEILEHRMDWYLPRFEEHHVPLVNLRGDYDDAGRAYTMHPEGGPLHAIVGVGNYNVQTYVQVVCKRLCDAMTIQDITCVDHEGQTAYQRLKEKCDLDAVMPWVKEFSCMIIGGYTPPKSAVRY